MSFTNCLFIPKIFGGRLRSPACPYSSRHSQPQAVSVILKGTGRRASQLRIHQTYMSGFNPRPASLPGDPLSHDDSLTV
jgi:hypothetical protein